MEEVKKKEEEEKKKVEGEEEEKKKETMQPGSAGSSLVACIIDPTTSTSGEVEASNTPVSFPLVQAVGSQPAEKAGQDHGDTGASSSAPRPSPLMRARQRAQARSAGQLVNYGLSNQSTDPGPKKMKRSC